MSSLSSLIKMCGGVCQLFVVGFPSLCQLHLRCGFCSATPPHWRKVIAHRYTGEKLLYGATLEKSYYTLPHCWRKVIINRHTGDKLSTSSHTGKKLSETAFSLKTRPISSTWHSPAASRRQPIASHLCTGTGTGIYQQKWTKTNKTNKSEQNQQKLGSKYESDQCSGSVANDLELFPAVCDLRCSLYKSEDQQ